MKFKIANRLAMEGLLGHLNYLEFDNYGIWRARNKFCRFGTTTLPRVNLWSRNRPIGHVAAK
jgi:hypothetical protein